MRVEGFLRQRRSLLKPGVGPTTEDLPRVCPGMIVNPEGGYLGPDGLVMWFPTLRAHRGNPLRGWRSSNPFPGVAAPMSRATPGFTRQPPCGSPERSKICVATPSKTTSPTLRAGMGYDFKAPKAEAAEEWEVIRALYDHGFAFHGCGCSVGYTPPKKISGLQAFFRAHGRLSEGERLLERLKQIKT
jgi:hypothetical protein